MGRMDVIRDVDGVCKAIQVAEQLAARLRLWGGPNGAPQNVGDEEVLKAWDNLEGNNPST